MNDVNSEIAQETTGIVKNEKSHTELQTGIKVMGVCLCGWQMHSGPFIIFFTMCYVHVWSRGQESEEVR